MPQRRHVPVILVTLYLATVLALPACGGADARKAKYLERGKNHIAQKDYEKAAVELRNVLQIDPKHAEAYYLLGTAMEAQGEFPKAFGNYAKAVELDPNHMDARKKVARFDLILNRLVEATAEVDAILAKNPNDTDGRFLRAAIMAKQGDPAGALKLALDVAAADPANDDVLVLVAQLTSMIGKPEEGVRMLEARIAADPKNVKLRLVLARYFESAGVKDSALAHWREIVALAPDNLDYRNGLVASYTRFKMPIEAEAVLRDAVKLAPTDPRRYLALAQYVQRERGTVPAIDELLAAIKKLPEENELRFALVQVYTGTRAFDKAESVLREIVRDQGKKPEGLMARNQLAGLLIDSGRGAEGSKLIQEVLEENPRDNQALMLDAIVALSENDALRAITSLREVVKDQPDSVEALALLANAHLRNNEIGLAKENLQKAVEVAPKDPRTRLALAEFYRRQNDPDAAMKELERNLADHKDHFDTLVAQSQLLAAKNDSKRLEAVLTQITKAYPDRPAGYVGLGRLYGAQRKYDAALREFDAALTKVPGQPDALAGMVTVYGLQNQTDKALKRLETVTQADPQNAVAHKLTSEILVVLKRPAEAQEALKRAIAAQPKWNQPYLALAGLKIADNDVPGALATISDGIKALPEDVRLLTRLAEIHDRRGNVDEAIAVYSGMLEKNPNNLVAANNLASLLVDRKGDPASIKRAIEIASRFENSDQPVYVDTLGWAQYKAGNIQKAVELLKRAADKAPDIPVIRYHLGLAYQQQGDKAAARTNLEAALKRAPNFPEADSARAALAAMK